jgi:CRISPR system Cascade subunit CasC
MRKSPYHSAHLGEGAIRTRSLDLLKDKSVDHPRLERFSSELIILAIDLMGGHKGSDILMPWSVSEIETACMAIEDARAEGVADDGLCGKVEEVLKKQAGLVPVDVALTGRMVTSGIMSRIDGALSVAHAFTTHTVDSDVDWFTAMDDLTEEYGKTGGAAHLNTQEFGAGVFYRYISLNIGQLERNMAAGRVDALHVAADYTYLLTTVVPSGKQHGFATFDLADFALVSFADMPISAGNAFEAPVRQNGRGFLEPSIRALEQYVDSLRRGYGIDDLQAAFSPRFDTALSPRLNTLEELKDWIRSDGRQ